MNFCAKQIIFLALVFLMLPWSQAFATDLNIEMENTYSFRIYEEDGWYDFVEGIIEAPLTNQFINGFCISEEFDFKKTESVFVIPEVDFESVGFRVDVRF